MMVPVNGGGSGCGLGSWLEIWRVPKSGSIEVAFACATPLVVSTHWVKGRTHACGGGDCPLCERLGLRTYVFLGVQLLRRGGDKFKAILELPYRFAAGSSLWEADRIPVGRVQRFFRNGSGRHGRIAEERVTDKLAVVEHLVTEDELLCSVAGVLGLQVTGEQMRNPRDRYRTFAAACLAEAQRVAGAEGG